MVTNLSHPAQRSFVDAFPITRAWCPASGHGSTVIETVLSRSKHQRSVRSSTSFLMEKETLSFRPLGRSHSHPYHQGPPMLRSPTLWPQWRRHVTVTAPLVCSDCLAVLVDGLDAPATTYKTGVHMTRSAMAQMAHMFLSFSCGECFAFPQEGHVSRLGNMGRDKQDRCIDPKHGSIRMSHEDGW